VKQLKSIVFIEGENCDPAVFQAVREIITNAVEIAYQDKKRLHFIEAFIGKKAKFYYKNKNIDTKNLYTDDIPNEALNLIREHKNVLSGPLASNYSQGFIKHLELDLLHFDINSFKKLPTYLKNNQKIHIKLFGLNELYFNNTTNDEKQNLIKSIQNVFEYAINNKYKSIVLLQKNKMLADVFYHSAKEYYHDIFIAAENCGGNTPNNKILIDDERIDTFFSKFIFNVDKYNLLLVDKNYSFLMKDMLSAISGTTNINSYEMRSSHLGISIFQSPQKLASNLIGYNKANPIPYLLAGILLLNHIEYKEAALLLLTSIQNMFTKKHVPLEVARNIDEAVALNSSDYLNEIKNYLTSC